MVVLFSDNLVEKIKERLSRFFSDSEGTFSFVANRKAWNPAIKAAI
jgi:hypothetical protein